MPLFSSTYQPANHGRKKAPWRQFIDEIGLEQPEVHMTKRDFFGILQHLLSCNNEQIKEMAKRPDIPVSVFTIIKAIKQDIDDGTTKTVDNLIDRIYGKANQPITGAEGRPLVPSMMSDEQIMAEIERLKKIGD